MSIQVASNRFIDSSFAGFYQQLLSEVSSFQELGDRLVCEAETAQAFRQIERLQELSEILSNFPVNEYRLIGQYYLGWCGYFKGENPREAFEKVVEESKTYKIKALTSMGATEDASGDYGLAAKYYSEALKYARTSSHIAEAARGIALIKAKEGYNHRALKELEKIWPIVKLADSHVYHQYLNSLAVELCEAGRIQEARSVINIVLASPYAFAYPEWRETSNDIALRGYKSRSVIYFDVWNIAKNVLYLPENSIEVSTQSQPGTVSTLEEWKEKMVKEPNGENLDEMSEQDMIAKLLELMAQGVNDKQKIRALLDHALKLFSKD